VKYRKREAQEIENSCLK